MKIVQLTLTYNRHSLIERLIKCFLDQDYDGEHHLFIYNTGEITELDDISLPPNKKITLINNTKDYNTGNDYTSVGYKYRDALSHLNGYDVICFVDDDDYYLPNHFSEGIKGYNKALSLNKLAYKPMYSFFRSVQGMQKINNIFEGSFFLNFDFIKKCNFPNLSVKYHNETWVNPLEIKDKIHVEKTGTSTWIYDWNVPVYKMSGRQEGQQNYNLSVQYIGDVGDGKISPVSNEFINSFYKEVEYIK